MVPQRAAPIFRPNSQVESTGSAEAAPLVSHSKGSAIVAFGRGSQTALRQPKRNLNRSSGVKCPKMGQGGAMHAVRTSVHAPAARGNICRRLNTHGYNPTRNN